MTAAHAFSADGDDGDDVLHTREASTKARARESQTERGGGGLSQNLFCASLARTTAAPLISSHLISPSVAHRLAFGLRLTSRRVWTINVGCVRFDPALIPPLPFARCCALAMLVLFLIVLDRCMPYCIFSTPTRLMAVMESQVNKADQDKQSAAASSSRSAKQ